MPFCPRCGARLKTENYCPICGLQQPKIEDSDGEADGSAQQWRVEAATTAAASCDEDDCGGEEGSSEGFETANTEVAIRGCEEVSPNTLPLRREKEGLFSKLGRLLAPLLNTKDHTAECTEEDIEENRLYAALAYLSLLVLVPGFLAKGSKYARFHVNQGAVLTVTTAIYFLLKSIFLELIEMVGFGLLAKVLWYPLQAIGIGFLCLIIIGLVNACQGKARELPLIGRQVIVPSSFEDPEV